MNALELVDTQELVDELQRRYCNYILVANKELDSQMHETYLRWNGHVLKCMGLLRIAERQIMDEYSLGWDEFEEDDDDD